MDETHTARNSAKKLSEDILNELSNMMEKTEAVVQKKLVEAESGKSEGNEKME